MSNNHCVYKLTFPNGKIYIGQCDGAPQKRWREGEGYKGQYVYAAIQEYGWAAIKKEILSNGLSLNEANDMERYYIQFFNSRDEGYNRTDGGDNSTRQSTTKKIAINAIQTQTNNIIINKDAFFIAAKNLTLNGLRVYMYFMTLPACVVNGKINSDYPHRSGFIRISSSEIANIISIDVKSVTRGIEELIKQGYLIIMDKNTYIFYNVLPQDGKNIKEDTSAEAYNRALKESMHFLNNINATH